VAVANVEQKGDASQIQAIGSVEALLRGASSPGRRRAARACIFKEGQDVKKGDMLSP